METKARRTSYAMVGVGLAAVLALVIFWMLPRPAAISANCQKAIDDGICQNKNKCDVKIELARCGQPVVKPEELAICDVATITWTLVASSSATGAKFAANGIAFKAADGGTAHYDTPPKVRDTTYEYKDKHKKSTDPAVKYEYGIHILTPSEPNCVNTDPRISNE